MFASIAKGRNSVIVSALLVFGAVLWMMPQPEGLDVQAWHLLVAFVVTIALVMTNIMPLGLITMLGTVFCIGMHLISIDRALSGFSSSVVWLVVFAFFIARGLIKTGLGSRIAYIFMQKLGHNPLGLSYGLVLTELVLAPVIPSSSARGGGVLLPIVESLTDKYAEQHAEHREIYRKHIGEFLALLCFHANVITSTMFVTAMAANPITIKLAAPYGVDITWGTWALGALVPGLLSLLLFPIVLMFVCKPDFGKNREVAPRLAAQALNTMGRLSSKEVVVLLIFALLLTLWGAERTLEMHAATTAMLGVVILVLTKVLTWGDVLSEKSAWDTMIWFAILVMLSDSLAHVGVASWIGAKMNNAISGIDNITLIVVVSCIAFFYTHYMFASILAHLTVMYVTFLSTFLHLGLPPLPTALGLGYLAVLSGGLTHYGISAAPIFFGVGYTSTAKWWKKSFVITLLNFIIWATSGLVWWKVLGWY